MNYDNDAADDYEKLNTGTFDAYSFCYYLNNKEISEEKLYDQMGAKYFDGVFLTQVVERCVEIDNSATFFAVFITTQDNQNYAIERVGVIVGVIQEVQNTLDHN